MESKSSPSEKIVKVVVTLAMLLIVAITIVTLSSCGTVKHGLKNTTPKDETINWESVPVNLNIYSAGSPVEKK